MWVFLTYGFSVFVLFIFLEFGSAVIFGFLLFLVWKLVSQQEIVSLYKRFCQLDRNSKGFISADEFLSVPEFAMNPLSQVGHWIDFQIAKFGFS